MATCLDVADYFIANSDPDDPMTHLKLEKLCSYAQAFSLALLDRPLFENKILAFTHGPVIEEVKNKYSDCKNNPITGDITPIDSRKPFDDEQLFVLETVNGYYGEYSASRLRRMSHFDFPANFNDFPGKEIPRTAIAEAFKNNDVIKTLVKEFSNAV